MSKALKIAIIGCGRIGQRHAEHASTFGQLVAVCDKIQGKADALGDKYSAKVVYELDSLINSGINVDLIAVCSPNGLHAEHSIASLTAGFHVLCEKPMALSLVEAGKMIEAAERANRRLFIVKQNRFNPPVVALKELLDGEKLGDIFSVQLNCFWNRNPEYYVDSDWKGSLSLDGGTLFTQFSHFIDLLLYLFGDVIDICGFMDNYNHRDEIDFEDTGVLALRFRSGIIGSINYTVNSFAQNMEGSLTVFGRNGTFKVGGKYLNEVEYQSIEGHVVEGLPEGGGANNYGNYFGSMSNHDQVYQNVVDVLMDRGVISTNSYEGLKTVELIERMYEKIRK